MDSERFTKKKDVRRRMRKEAFQLRLEEQAAAKKEAAAPNPFVGVGDGGEMSMNDLVRSIPVLDDLDEEKKVRSNKREEAPVSIETLMNSSLFDELDEEKEPSKRQRKKSKVKKKTKMTPSQIAEQWDRVLEHDAFKAQGAAVLAQHINNCFEKGILK